MLTTQQRQALEFVVDYQNATGGVSPSLGEMCFTLGLASKSSAHRLVHQLVDRGCIRLMPGKNRAMEVVRFLPKAASGLKPLLVFKQARYFKFDDEEKRFVEWKKP